MCQYLIWIQKFRFYTLPHDSGRALWFHVGCPRVRPPVNPFVCRESVRIFVPDDNLSKCQWISTKLGICIYIDLVLDCFFGRFRQFMAELSARDMSVVSFQDDNLRKYQWNFTKFGVCIDNPNGRISSLLTELSAVTHSYFRFWIIAWVKSQWIFTKLDTCQGIDEIWFWSANGQISSIFDRVLFP